MTRVTPRLPAPLLGVLERGTPALLLTVGADGSPTAAFTWCVASDPERVRFAVDHGSSALHNLERETRTAIEVVAEGGLVFLLKGRARLVKRALDAAAALGMSLFEMQLLEARDQSWASVEVSPLRYEWTEPRAEMEAVEAAILAEMRTADG